MNEGTPSQTSFNFDLPEARDGLSAWREQRTTSRRRLARNHGVPLDRQVEVWLKGNIRLRGVLKLREELLFTEEEVDTNLDLEVDGVPFKRNEIESCVVQETSE